MILSIFFSILSAFLWQNSVRTNSHPLTDSKKIEVKLDTLQAIAIEPWTYADDFEDRDLGAWASYPLWQDIAYNQNFRVNEIIPGDPNISIVQKVTPYTAVDNYAGAQKLLDMYLVPESTIKFRYYLKSNQPCAWYKVRFAGGELGKLDFTIDNPKLNQWVWVTVTYEDIIRQNPVIQSDKKVKIHALGFLAKFPNADPDMPFYLGLDDISFKGARPAAFQFIEPDMYKLPEFDPYIPKRHYYPEGLFKLSGKWVANASSVSLEITPYTNREIPIYQESLSKQGETWNLSPLRIDFPVGLYLGTLKAFSNTDQIAQTTFTIHVAPKNIAGQHPRLLFNSEEKKEIDRRFTEDRFQKVYGDIRENAKILRNKIPVESLHFDLDQFPDEIWLPSWDSWGSRIYHTGTALRLNARAYAFHGDQEAGEYVKQMMLVLASWPNWTHPWQTKRGRFSEHRTGDWSHRLAEAYDLIFPLMNEEEGALIRNAIMKNIVGGVYRTYIYNDNITAATSNWLAMTVGGSLMCLSAVFDDGEDTRNIEPYFTGSIIKLDKFLHKVTDSKDGAWGEGFGYNSYSFSNLSYSLPSVERVFNIDLSGPLPGTYNEYIWAGLIKNKRWFEYGDSKGELSGGNNWAYLLSKYKEPRLSWFVDFLKEDLPTGSSEGNAVDHLKKESYEDVIFNTAVIPNKNPFSENPVKLFRQIGTTVFKSGWESDDFVFVMRTGPAYNHQHLDQGSFWLADRGKIFVQERPLSNSHYYDDPIYESWLTQPVGHSTILVNGNHQSQRVGDHLDFAPGFNDYAYVSHFLDGENAAFVTGDIGRLYWGKIDNLSRNVLYLKPRTLLMLDVAIPAEEDADITLLYQAERLSDIHADDKISTIVKDGVTLHLQHLTPFNVQVKSVETPHYLRTLQRDKPLEREGMLTVTGRTNKRTLVIANLLSTTNLGDEPETEVQMHEDFVSGSVSGSNFAFSTKPGSSYQFENFTTDAMAIAWKEDQIFVAQALSYKNDHFGLKSEVPVTFESKSNQEIKFYIGQMGQLTLTLAKRPKSIFVNNHAQTISTYDAQSKSIKVNVPEGEGSISVK